MSSAMASFCSTSRIEMPRLRDLLEQPRDLLDDLRREALGRLVDHDQLRIAHQRAAQRQHLLLAAREHAGRRVGALRAGAETARTCPPCVQRPRGAAAFHARAPGSGAP